MQLNELVEMSHNLAKQKGFWDKERNFGEMIALCHSELTEALEEYREGFDPTYIYKQGEKMCGVPTELADCVIRIFDICGYFNIDLEQVILDKLNYNSTREYKHGKVF
jgi:NTP pyrophosphatase (non-canonical NTP hydrolase)